MRHFGIYSPVLGLQKSWPSVFLNKAFTSDCANVRFDIGEVQSAMMRQREFVEALYTTGTVTASSGNAVVTGSGTAWVSGIMAGRRMSIEGIDYEIESVDSPTQITLTINYTGAGGSGLTYEIGTVSPVTKVPSPDGYPFVKYRELTTIAGEKKLVGFTKRHIYRWDTATTAWVLLFTGTSDCDIWSEDLWKGGVIATNNIDKPIWWNGSDSGFSYLGSTTSGCIVASGISITTAKALKVFENHIVLGNYATSDGEIYPNGCICCDIDSDLYAAEEQGSATNWLQDGTTDATNWFVAGAGTIHGFGVKGENLYIFKERSVRFYWFTATSTIFAGKNYGTEVGCFAADSICNDAYGNLYFYASDLTFREVDKGILSLPIKEIAQTINQSLLNKLKSFYVEEYGEVWWSVPYGEGITENNKVLCCRSDGIWTVRDTAITGFGKYSRQASWDWSSLYIYDNWMDWDWPNWMMIQATAGFLSELCSDSSGNTYLLHASTLDDGVTFTSYFVLTTDLADGALMRAYKRLLRILIYARNEGGGTMTVYVKRDNETVWQEAGEISLDGDEDILIKEIPVDYRAKTYLFKFEATNKFRFLGTEFDYLLAGER